MLKQMVYFIECLYLFSFFKLQSLSHLYEYSFLSVQTPIMLFTGLEDYKARGTQASPYFTVSYYTELAESKDLVLIRGDVVFTSKLTDSEAKWLIETAQSFYLNDARYKLVERFNKDAHEFEFTDVLRALDMPIL
jgi:ATP synthase F1 complex assembly factor 1